MAEMRMKNGENMFYRDKHKLKPSTTAFNSSFPNLMEQKSHLVDGIGRMLAYAESAYWSMPSPLSLELSQCVDDCCGRSRLPGSTLPGIRAAESNLLGIALPGCRFDGIRSTFRWTRDAIVAPVDMVIRITVNKNKNA